MIVQQRTDEWRKARLGYVTASRFADVMTEPRSKSDPISKTAESYMLELIGEHLSGQPADEFENYAMRHGTEFEPIARDAYTWHTGSLVEETGFEIHDAEEWIGCSPDGFVTDALGGYGQLEIKCPLTYREHVRVLASGECPDEHLPQVQGGMWVTGLDWCDFESYHPKMKHESHKLVVVRVFRDRAYIGKVEEKVVRFRDLMLERLELIKVRTA